MQAADAGRLPFRCRGSDSKPSWCWQSAEWSSPWSPRSPVVYVSQIFRQRINQSYDNADFIAHQVLHAARQALETELPDPQSSPPDPTQARDAIAAILQHDDAVTSLLQSVVGYNVEVYDTALADRNGIALVDTDAGAVDKPVPRRPALSALRDGGFLDQLRAVYGPARVYEVTLPVQRQGAPFGEIRVGLSTLFLKQELVPQLNRALLLSGVAVAALADHRRLSLQPGAAALWGSSPAVWMP